jgi:16S rRNA (guanine966-N2)-methyltransferase
MYIIAGKHRRRKIQIPNGHQLRPSTGQLREALFNILQHWPDFNLQGARVADLCCGSGALGLEALSRGAAKIVFIDQHPQAIACAKENVMRFGEIANAEFICCDSTRLPKAHAPCDLVLMDPPYRQPELVQTALSSLQLQGWLGPETIIVLEEDSRTTAALPGWEVLDDRTYGRSRLRIVRFIPCLEIQ